MTEFFNFHGTLFVFTGNWIWITLSLAIGIWFGWATAKADES